MARLVALFDCDGEDEEELSFRRGDVLVDACAYALARNVCQAEDDGWYRGTLESTGQHGLFPSNYVEPLPVTRAPTIAPKATQRPPLATPKVTVAVPVPDASEFATAFAATPTTNGVAKPTMPTRPTPTAAAGATKLLAATNHQTAKVALNGSDVAVAKNIAAGAAVGSATKQPMLPPRQTTTATLSVAASLVAPNPKPKPRSRPASTGADNPFLEPENPFTTDAEPENPFYSSSPPTPSPEEEENPFEEKTSAAANALAAALKSTPSIPLRSGPAAGPARQPALPPRSMATAELATPPLRPQQLDPALPPRTAPSRPAAVAPPGAVKLPISAAPLSISTTSPAEHDAAQAVAPALSPKGAAVSQPVLPPRSGQPTLPPRTTATTLEPVTNGETLPLGDNAPAPGLMKGVVLPPRGAPGATQFRLPPLKSNGIDASATAHSDTPPKPSAAPTMPPRPSTDAGAVPKPGLPPRGSTDTTAVTLPPRPTPMVDTTASSDPTPQMPPRPARASVAPAAAMATSLAPAMPPRPVTTTSTPPTMPPRSGTTTAAPAMPPRPGANAAAIPTSAVPGIATAAAPPMPSRPSVTGVAVLPVKPTGSRPVDDDSATSAPPVMPPRPGQGRPSGTGAAAGTPSLPPRNNTGAGAELDPPPYSELDPMTPTTPALPSRPGANAQPSLPPRGGSAAAAAPKMPPRPGTGSAATDWAIPADTVAYHKPKFILFDTDKDGFLDANQVRSIFMESGLDKKLLAQIWVLCDSKKRSKLNCDEFILGMYLIEQYLQGVPIPQLLPANLVPPSSR